MEVASETASSALRGGGSERDRVWKGLKVVDTYGKRGRYLPTAPHRGSVPCDSLDTLDDCVSGLRKEEEPLQPVDLRKAGEKRKLTLKEVDNDRAVPLTIY